MTDTEKLAIAKAALRRIGLGMSGPDAGACARSAIAAMYGAMDAVARDAVADAREDEDNGGEMPRRSGT